MKDQPAQAVCSDPGYQRRRRTEYHRAKIAADPEYCQVCLDSPQKWRSRKPDYWRRYREQHRPRSSGTANGNPSEAQNGVYAILQTTTSWLLCGVHRITEVAPMPTTDQIDALHRLYWSERWPTCKVERHLRMTWRTIKKYLDAPAQRQRESKLDPFKTTIAEWPEKDYSVTAGGSNRDCGHPVTAVSTPSCASMCTAPSAGETPASFFAHRAPPGERFEVDLGHLGVLDYFPVGRIQSAQAPEALAPVSQKLCAPSRRNRLRPPHSSRDQSNIYPRHGHIAFP